MTHVCESATVEPNGFDLDDEHRSVSCPACGGTADYHNTERLEDGAINFYSRTACHACGHVSGDWPGLP